MEAAANREARDSLSRRSSPDQLRRIAVESATVFAGLAGRYPTDAHRQRYRVAKAGSLGAVAARRVGLALGLIFTGGASSSSGLVCARKLTPDSVPNGYREEG